MVFKLTPRFSNRSRVIRHATVNRSEFFRTDNYSFLDASFVLLKEPMCISATIGRSDYNPGRSKPPSVGD